MKPLFLSKIFLLPLFRTTFILSLKFLAHAYRELWPADKNDPCPVLIGLNKYCLVLKLEEKQTFFHKKRTSH